MWRRVFCKVFAWYIRSCKSILAPTVGLESTTTRLKGLINLSNTLLMRFIHYLNLIIITPGCQALTKVISSMYSTSASQARYDIYLRLRSITVMLVSILVIYAKKICISLVVSRYRYNIIICFL